MPTEPHELILDQLRAIRGELTELAKMRGEMREGFANQRAHNAVTYGDQALLERRIVDLEIEVDRMKRRLNLADAQD